MSEMSEPTQAPPPPAPPPPPAENPFWTALRQPRVVLILLAAWAIIGALTEFFTSSGLFVDLDHELDGALGGRALSWEAIPLATLYLYCSRDPVRYRSVFWLALVEQAAAIVANVYHWGAGDFSFESVFIPIAVAGGLGVLAFLQIFQPKEPEESSVGTSSATGA